ncbi:unnamed protein product [Cuscuta campestris]|uniref:Reverse transcriptase domain-containing protein n=1 Tax=Cuscuta campestris TaxID=132261 RepID=A0A484NA06_9ASTE|nr:unnamed protein product [Cuscuta campestris]
MLGQTQRESSMGGLESLPRNSLSRTVTPESPGTGNTALAVAVPLLQTVDTTLKLVAKQADDQNQDGANENENDTSVETNSPAQVETNLIQSDQKSESINLEQILEPGAETLEIDHEVQSASDMYTNMARVEALATTIVNGRDAMAPEPAGSAEVKAVLVELEQICVGEDAQETIQNPTYIDPNSEIEQSCNDQTTIGPVLQSFEVDGQHYEIRSYEEAKTSNLREDPNDFQDVQNRRNKKAGKRGTAPRTIKTRSYDPNLEVGTVSEITRYWPSRKSTTREKIVTTKSYSGPFWHVGPVGPIGADGKRPKKIMPRNLALDQHPGKEDSPIFPVWVTMDKLPLHLIDFQALYTIGTLLGRPVKVDDYTVNRYRRESARICIEIDLSLPPPPKINIRLGEKDLVINCTYESRPIFCTQCKKLGHKIGINCSNSCNSNIHLPTGKVPSGKGKVGIQGENNLNWEMVRRKKTRGIQLKEKATKQQALAGEQGLVANRGFQNGAGKKGPTIYEWKAKVSNNFTTPNLMDLLYNEEENLQDDNTSQGGIRDTYFPTLSEAKAYAARSHKQKTLADKAKSMVDKHSDLITSITDSDFICSKDYCNIINTPPAHKGSMDDCINISSPVKGLAMLIEEVHHLPATEDDMEGINGFGYHSEGDGVRSNGRVLRRLDRVLVNKQMIDSFDDITITHISNTSSDHKPILLQCKSEDKGGAKPFKFPDAWINHHGFHKLVEEYWNNNTTYSGMYGLGHKLKGLKSVIKEWNNKVFGNIFTNLKKAEENAVQAQEAYEIDHTSSNREADNKARAQLLLAVANECSFWKQKANIKWMEEGDSNSKFFHDFVKGRRARSKIRSMTDQNGKMCTDLSQIQKMAVDHYTKLFWENKQVQMDPILEYLEQTITPTDNDNIMKIPTEKEIRDAVWNLNPNSAPGPDGFNGNFFKSCWGIIKDDVVRATQEFFLGVPVPKSYGSTFISLIPKKEDPKEFGEYRPISLSTFMSKINTRLLADRIQNILPKIISSEQTGFQKGMGIDDQILLVEEMVHKIEEKTRGGNMIIKLDMAKAFDNLEWGFIQGVLKKLGFSTQVISLLMANLKATYFSILINGSPYGFFQMKRGVKQGDPLSPLLFIIAAEGLSKAIHKSMESSYIKNFNTGRDLLISHLAYADDITIFSNGDARNLLKLKNLLQKYLDASGQEINYNKSRFYTGIKARDISKIENLLHMKHDRLPFKYLGAPICKGKLKKTDCGELLNHFSKYIDTWYSKTLNQMGRLILIKHVLSSIPLHLIAVHTLPKSIINKLHSMMSNFFWGKNNKKEKHHWKKWGDLCLPKSEGGLGLRDLHELQEAYSIKLWWNYRHSSSKWAHFMRAKYGTLSFEEKLTDSPTRKRICRIHIKAEEYLGDLTRELEEEDENEEIHMSIKQAFEYCRIQNNFQLSDKFNWNTLQIPKVQMFLWKANNNILPFPEALGSMGYCLPSRCPFCHNAEMNIDHCLLQCNKIREIWEKLASICEGPELKERISLKQHVMEWNLRSDTKTLRGVMKLILPGMISWSIWKHYAEITFGNEKENITAITQTLKKILTTWSWKYKHKGWMIKDNTLMDLGLQTFALSGETIRMAANGN